METPGGGSAAALAGALGCSLGAKVFRILGARQESSKAAGSKRWHPLIRRFDQLSRKLIHLAEKDAQAYTRLVKAFRTGRNRSAARRGAIEAPLEICTLAASGFQKLKRCLTPAGPHLGSDLRAGMALLRGAFEAAEWMVQVNLQGVRGMPWDRYRKRLISLRRVFR